MEINSTQKYLLFFLCGLIFLTVISVLLANLGILNDSTLVQDFARWGQVAVLAEIIGLFVLVSKGIFFKSSERLYSLIFTIENLPSNILEQIIWDKNNCYIEYNGSEKENVSPTNRQTIEIQLSSNFYNKIQKDKPIKVYLADTKRNKWHSVSMFLFRNDNEKLNFISDKNKFYKDYSDEEE